MLRLENGGVVLGQGVQVAGNPPNYVPIDNDWLYRQTFNLECGDRRPVGTPNKMADGTAWRGHLPVTQDIRGDRYPYRSPILGCLQQQIYIYFGNIKVKQHPV